MRIALKESLSKVGYAVSMADNGLKAVEEIDRNMFDLVISRCEDAPSKRYRSSPTSQR